MIAAKATVWLAVLAHVANCQGDPINIEPDLLWPREPYSEYSYPSPNATGRGGWDTAIAKAKRFVDRLTIEEKVTICTGTGFP
jgi:beta-glucosidase